MRWSFDLFRATNREYRWRLAEEEAAVRRMHRLSELEGWDQMRQNRSRRCRQFPVGDALQKLKAAEEGPGRDQMSDKRS